ncbi:MAG: ion transporter [Bacteroidota bacterium]
MSEIKKRKFHPLREKIHEVIFEADTPDGKLFDVLLIISIIASVLVVTLESVQSIQDRYGLLFDVLEWIFTIFFTIEYILRLYVVYKPLKYALSFYGIIDLLSILPSYLSLIFIGYESLMVIRAFRLMRIFRIFKLGKYSREGRRIMSAMRASSRRIFVFLMFVLLLVTIFGSVMYLIEGSYPNSSFDSIPRSIYWAIVTLTTVGYGDISPQTSFGQFIAAMVMILGYAVLAVPTGIVTSELINEATKSHNNTQSCRHCTADNHADDAKYCDQCGELLNEHD